MNRSRLRVYFGPEDQQSVDLQQQPKAINRVTVSLSDVFPLLADAVQTDRAWLRDFSDDEVTISQDLYDVLMAYQHYRRPSA